MERDRLPDTLRNIAAATSSLDPHVVLQMMQTDEGMQESPILGRIAAAFDDGKVADLLAAALSRDGKASHGWRRSSTRSRQTMNASSES